MQSNELMKFSKPSLKKIPESCGVYLFYTSNQNIIYIGKSINLKSRIKSYFYRGKKNHHIRKKRLVHNISFLKYIETKTELAALLLEDDLIKKHQPEYNIKQNEYKEYIYLEITDDIFPAIELRKQRDSKLQKKLIFGPLKDKYYFEDLKKFLTSVFSIRFCNDREPRQKCLKYKLNNCSAPCRELITAEAYNKVVKNVISFLKGDCSQVMRALQRNLKEHNQKLEFEKSAAVRDKIKFSNNFCRRQKFLNNFITKNLLINLKSALQHAFLFRKGKMVVDRNKLLNISKCKQKLASLPSEQKPEKKYILFDRANIIYKWLNSNSKKVKYFFFK